MSTARLTAPRLMAVDANGSPLPGAKLNTYDAGTTTPRATFSDDALSVQHANPIIADSAGVFPDIYLSPVQYKLVLTDAADASVWTADPVSADNFAVSTAGGLGDLATLDAGAGVADDGSGGLALDVIGLTAVAAEDGDSVLIADASDSDAVKRATVASIRATVGMPRGYMGGLTIVNSITYGSDGIILMPGAARDSADSQDITLSAALDKRLNGTWVSGTGNSGLDTGSVASDTFYAVLVIYNPSTQATDALFTVDPGAPTLPSGFTKYRRLGWVRTDGSSNIRPFFQHGDTFRLLTRIADVNAVTIGTSASLHTLTVPGNLIALLDVTVTASTSGTYALITDPDETDATVASGASNIGDSGTGNSAHMAVPVDSTGQIRARAGSAARTLDVNTRGWIDTRGRDD